MAHGTGVRGLRPSIEIPPLGVGRCYRPRVERILGEGWGSTFTAPGPSRREGRGSFGRAGRAIRRRFDVEWSRRSGDEVHLDGQEVDGWLQLLRAGSAANRIELTPTSRPAPLVT